MHYYIHVSSESDACGLLRSISRIKDNFSRRLTHPDELFLKTWFITKIKFSILENNPKRRLTLSQHTQMWSLKRSSEHLRAFLATSSENRRECSESRDMTRRKPQAFDSEIVGRYKFIMPKQLGFPTFSRLLGCLDAALLPQYTILPSYRWYIARIFQIWSTLVSYEELAGGLKPTRNGQIFWMNN